MVIRESVLGRTLSWFTAITWLLFATLCGLFGDHVTSKQWTYLMSVPGRKWFWCVAFGVGTLAAIIGLIRKRYVLTSWPPS